MVIKYELRTRTGRWLDVDSSASGRWLNKDSQEASVFIGAAVLEVRLLIV